MKPVILIPSLEPDEALFKLVRKMQNNFFYEMILVDDGSGEEYQYIFRILEKEGVIVCHHGENKGKGEAIKTGIKKAERMFRGRGVITMDADGQHLPEDIRRIAREAEKEPDMLILGIRNLKEKNVPFKSRWGNAFSSFFFHLSTGFSCPDTQTGLRYIPASWFPLALKTEGTRYEYEMNFLSQAARQKAPIRMLPIQTVYLDGNKKSHFRPFSDSIRIYQTPLRFSAASGGSALLDLFIFSFLVFSFRMNGFRGNVYTGTALASVLARLVSGGFNFTLNRRWSFKSTGNVPNQMGKYLLLFFIQMILSSGVVSVLSVLPVWTTLVKIMVDSVLFLLSYYVQKNWVFRKKELDVIEHI